MPTRPLLTKYKDDLKLFPDRWHKIGIAFWTLFLLVFPFVVNAKWLGIGNLTLITIVGAIGLMILTGFTGQISLGHAAFLVVGAYTAGVLGHQYGMPFWLIIPAAGLLSAALGLIVGPFALRLEGLYLAIVTLGLLELVRHVLLSMPSLTKGISGLEVPMHSWFAESKASLGSFNQSIDLGFVTLGFSQKLYFLFLLIVLLILFFTYNLQRSNLGRSMMAVRDHDTAAAVMGVNPAKTKIIAFALSSFVTGIAGAMYGFQYQLVNVETPFNLLMSVNYIAMIVLGGVGTIFGAVAGAIVFTVLRPIAEIIGTSLPFLSNLGPDLQATVLFSIIVCGFMLFEPLGLFGIWLRIKRYFMAWPFRY